MTIYEHGWELWKSDVKQLLNFDLEVVPDIWKPTFKINDITIQISLEHLQDLFVSGPKNLPSYYDFGKILVKQYNILKQKQILLEIAEAGCGCA